ncbi:MAG: ORF6N domain-containing protein [Elusimicrobia bacterium]|nr:ORF6N domain-containing protein [Elusimicrobiota bacterium]
MAKKMKDIIPAEIIENKIFLIRGHKVMLDSDLAKIYGVSTGRLNQQFRRNRRRFPEDFAFMLTEREFKSLILQFAISKKGRGGRRKIPTVFTEHGAIMLASVLNSDLAIKASVQVVRAFVRLREVMGTHKELAEKMRRLEEKTEKHDAEIILIFNTIRKLMMPCPPEKPKKRIGFTVKEKRTKYRIY